MMTRNSVYLSFKLSITIVLICLTVKSHGSLADVTTSILGNTDDGVLAAFGDFNADKDTDIFVIDESGQSLKIYLAHKSDLFKEGSNPFTLTVLLGSNTANGTVITSVVPADFDGDSQMDVLVTRRRSGQDVASQEVTVQIYWGKTLLIGLEDKPLQLPHALADQPLVLDVNGDMLPDLMGEKEPGQRFYWTFNSNRNYTEISVSNGTQGTLPHLRTPQSSAFVDINSDLTADLCVLSQNSSNRAQVEFWYSQDGQLTWNKTIPLPENLKKVGQACFVDIDGNNKIDVVFPACRDEACAQSVILVLSEDKWHILPVNFNPETENWGFVPEKENPLHSIYNVPMTLRAGDFNLDGFPDLLAVLQPLIPGNSSQKAFLLGNVECPGSQCSGFTRSFDVQWSVSLTDDRHQALLPAFFDLTENGVLDILVTSVTTDNKPQIRCLQQTFTEDASFVKVMVVSGLCYTECPGGGQPYGVNQPGPVVHFKTTKPDGSFQYGIASQLSQSAYFSLQLPFVVFGLGQIPNFMDSLTVGIPHPYETVPQNRTWTMVIPNSQLIVIPYPNDQPSRWMNKLFLTPSRLIMLTGAALLGTCGFIVGIVGILHWREKLEDKKEKLQEAHRFHFDAM